MRKLKLATTTATSSVAGSRHRIDLPLVQSIRNPHSEIRNRLSLTFPVTPPCYTFSECNCEKGENIDEDIEPFWRKAGEFSG
jgi:hypothetical protein